MVKVSKNNVTLAHLKIACRHVDELVSSGVTENLAIRTLELFVDVYAKIHSGGSATPHHVDQVPTVQWSLAALKAKREKPTLKPGTFFRVEHGTPRRALAKEVLQLFKARKLTTRTLNSLIKKRWKLAVITVDEDIRLNKVARSMPHSSPDKRWATATIKFKGG